MGNQGFHGEATSPRFSLLCTVKVYSYYIYLYATKQVSDNENLHHRQTSRRDTGITPSVTLHMASYGTRT